MMLNYAQGRLYRVILNYRRGFRLQAMETQIIIQNHPVYLIPCILPATGLGSDEVPPQYWSPNRDAALLNQT
jgi:hypothetical protein